MGSRSRPSSAPATQAAFSLRVCGPPSRSRRWQGSITRTSSAIFDGTPLEIVHRDVSPHNVFLTYEGEVKIVDFGIAKATLNTLRTETGVLKGKLTYMAPEQTQGKADRRSDLFVLGIMLWEALSGRRLFRGSRSPS